MECNFCGKKGNWKNVLRDPRIQKKDGSDVILCDECIAHYAMGKFDKIKLKKPYRKVKYPSLRNAIKEATRGGIND